MAAEEILALERAARTVGRWRSLIDAHLTPEPIVERPQFPKAGSIVQLREPRERNHFPVEHDWSLRAEERRVAIVHTHWSLTKAQ